MAQPLSEHDEDFGSLDDFAPEQPAVQPRDADLESVRAFSSRSHCGPQTPGATAGYARSWFVGILVLAHRRRRGAWLAGDPASSGSQ